MVVSQFDVVLVNLDPTVGSECKKTRPCVVVSPSDMNRNLNTVIVAPMTSTIRGWAFRPIVTGKNKSELMLDQIRAVDKSRLVKVVGSIKQKERPPIKSVLSDMFS